MTEAVTPERTALYRIWGEDDLLLYIGISKDFGGRWKQHARIQPWWPEIRRLTVDGWYDFRVEAEIAEEVAIKSEKPKYNKTHSVVPPAKDSEIHSPRHPEMGETAEEAMTRLHDRWAAESAEAADYFPGWGWWPATAWWRTWWQMKRDRFAGERDAWSVLKRVLLPAANRYPRVRLATERR